ncbi:MAG: hypothetical protein EOO45_00355 [Flavobacterium sp.]|nr:MAG: hypothetical protein EOO45_00355 [Flavobacterium sp.]
MVGLKNSRLESATLIEVLIAMVIIVGVFATAVAVFTNVLSSGVSSQKVKAVQQMQRMRIDLVKSGTFDKELLNIDSITYQIEPLETGVDGVGAVRIKADLKGRSLGEVRFQYILKNQDERP